MCTCTFDKLFNVPATSKLYNFKTYIIKSILFKPVLCFHLLAAPNYNHRMKEIKI